MGSTIAALAEAVGAAAAPAQLLNAIITRLIRSDATHSATLLLKLARFQHRHKDPNGGESRAGAAVPAGPFGVDPNHPCALLIFVPRNLKSRLIDDGTGGYGYSHVTIDCAEVDQPTGKHVMTESTTQDVVHRSFQDHYGSRPYVRILLSNTGLNPGKFRECVNDKLGEQYDDKEALTWGAVDDPAKQICSDLAGDCLPSEVREDIAEARLAHKLRHLSVSVHRHFRKTPHVFISPNGFAEYFGAPPGAQVREPDVLVAPKSAPDGGREGGRLFGRGLAISLTLAGCVFIAWLVTERFKADR